jgi:DUF1365 family protein
MSHDTAIWLGTGEVRHTRLQPVHNAFRYPVFFLRIQVERLGSAPLPWPLRYNRWGWLSLHDRDYGDNTSLPLAQQIRRWLAQENILDVDGAIWLHTFPRVFGFVFNPVSFWFCERANGELRAVVCEVNNTFGERHWYLLAHHDGRALRYGQTLTAPKRFHVSPFFSVDGTYRFRFGLATGSTTATENQSETLRSLARIDYADNSGDLLHTSISGSLLPASTGRLVKVLFSTPCMTLGVLARIHWQAWRLWIKKVRFYKKPAPPEEKLTR